MKTGKLLVANRGEIAIRVMRAAAALGMRTVAVAPADDADSLHTRKADELKTLAGAGVAAYLDAAAIVAAAKEAGCDAIHPGYGFLAENAEFAKRCAAAKIRFVGPRPDLLELFGDKVRARSAAQKNDVPVMKGTAGATSLAEIRKFFASLGGAPMVIKALAGGGGRGIRVVRSAAEIEDAYARCESEAKAAFGNGEVYAEQLVERARHIEVQVLGDGSGAVAHLGERECSIQRRHQKLVEIAPSPALSAKARKAIIDAALRLAGAVRYDNIGTFEFLYDDAGGSFAFIEANPRLQVEHTVTEEVTGADIVRLQLELAAGRKLSELGLDASKPPEPRGYSIQLRVNAETMGADGAPIPSGGTLAAFEVPSGPGMRTDTYGYAGYRINPRYDSLLAKVIVHSPTTKFADAVALASRALAEFRIEGAPTNVAFLQSLLAQDDVAQARFYTRWLDEKAAAILGSMQSGPQGAKLYFEGAVQAAGTPASSSAEEGPEGSTALRAPMQGTIISVAAKEGDSVRAGQVLLVMEAMKLEHEIKAQVGGVLRRLTVAEADVVYEGHPLAFIEEREGGGAAVAVEDEEKPGSIRANLQELFDRRAKTLDANRPEAVAKQRKRGERTARENVSDLVDPGSFVEYGQLVVAAQRLRRPLEELIDKTPADGLITGIGSVNGDLFEGAVARCVVMAYDYSVLAGTQGMNNHRKTDRMIEVTHKMRLPMILFSQGGGGRPGDTDMVSGYDSTTFSAFPQLSGLVPMVCINSGPCFAGNAGLLGVSDVIIATRNSSIGMGGPAMVEGGGLGVYKVEEIGPIDVQSKNGVVDIVVADEAEGVRVAKKYLSYFQGSLKQWSCADQTLLRTVLPESRRRGYDPRTILTLLADSDSFLELRREFGIGIITGLLRIEGRPIGVLANNPLHLGGAIDSDASDKGARFINLCDAHDIPILSLIDNPGIMVGPEAEKTALVRHASRLFLAGANATVPFFSVVIRKLYGLGGVAMYGGNAKQILSTVAWPSGEFGGWGIEASVKLGYRKEMAAIADPDERQRYYQSKVDEQYSRGRAINHASMNKIDDVIDPAETRQWLAQMLAAVHPAPRREGKKRSMIDAW